MCRSEYLWSAVTVTSQNMFLAIAHYTLILSKCHTNVNKAKVKTFYIHKVKDQLHCDIFPEDYNRKAVILAKLLSDNSTCVDFI